MTAVEPVLAGVRILIPRGGTWGEMVSESLRVKGASTVIAPLVDFSHTSEEEHLVRSLHLLEQGYFDWITATNSTIIDVLKHHDVKIPVSTKAAIVGEATARALIQAGYGAPARRAGDTQELLRNWYEVAGDSLQRVLTMRSDIAVPTLTEALLKRGHDVTQVLAFRTIGVPAPERVREDISSGRINAILVASAKIASEVAKQFEQIPEDTLVCCVGASTREAAVQLGLPDDPQHPDYWKKREMVATVESVLDQSDMLD